MEAWRGSEVMRSKAERAQAFRLGDAQEHQGNVNYVAYVHMESVNPRHIPHPNVASRFSQPCTRLTEVLSQDGANISTLLSSAGSTSLHNFWTSCVNMNKQYIFGILRTRGIN
eukprot:1146352-Pelagomonas_calceolata.AAC.1